MVLVGETTGTCVCIITPDAERTMRTCLAGAGRLSAQHVQRLQKALELMNLKWTRVLGEVTGVTGLKIIRAILAGQRDPVQLARWRDRRGGHTLAQLAEALDGRYRPEHLLELRVCLALWEKYQQVIAEVDQASAGQLRSMRRV